MERLLRSVAIMIEVISRCMEWTHFNLDYSRMPAVAQQPQSMLIFTSIEHLPAAEKCKEATHCQIT